MSADSTAWLRLLRSRAGRTAPAARATRGELWLALCVTLVLAAIPVGRALVDGSLLFFPVDAANARAPWSTGAHAAMLGAQAGAPAESGTPDPGVALYPAWRYTIEELAARRLPTWNPLLATGVPWLANPHWGVFDPQVLALAALEVVGGQDLSDHGFAWLAWLRFAAAAFGAYVLARRMGLTPAGSAVAAAGFAGSGVGLAWSHSPVGHVAAVVPWVFVAIERLRERVSARSVAFVALATAALVLGGDPETAFFAGLAALLWAAFALEGRARSLGIAGLALGTLACAPVLLPFLEYVRHSSALSAMPERGTGFDLVSLGLVVVTIALVGAWRGLDPKSLTGARGLAGTAGIVFALVACAFVLAGRGLGPSARAFFLHDAYGSPASGGWNGAGTFADAAIAWVPAGIVALALASFLSQRGTLRSRGFVQALALGALLLAIAAPGVIHLWQQVPFFGLGATARAAAVAALFLSLLAGEALDAAPRVARRTAGLAFVALVTMVLVARAPAPPSLAADPPEPYFACTERPPAVWGAGPAALVGFVADELPCDQIVLRAERVAEDGRLLSQAAFSTPLALQPAGDKRRTFKSEPLRIEQFAPGLWRFALDLKSQRADGRLELMGSRDVAFSRIAPEPRMRPGSMVFTMLAFFALLFLAGSQSRWAWLALPLVALQAMFFARGVLHSVPRNQPFELTRTERLLQEQSGMHRVLGGRGVLPGNTPLLRRIRSAGGHTGLELAAFDSFRLEALQPGADPVRDWNADSVDFASNAFRLLGVSMLAFTTRADPPGFDLVAGPERDCPKPAETFVYQAHEPLPRAFCVGRIVDRTRMIRDPRALDPLREAFLEDGATWRPVTPFTISRVELEECAGNRARLTADVDGDALLVLTDAAYPGWIARVDGVEQAVLTVDGLFRGIALAKGRHVIELVHAPASLRWGGWIGLFVGVLLLALALVPWPRRKPTTT